MNSTERRVVRTDTPVRRALERRTVGSLLLWGLFVWFCIAVAMRLVGHVLLSPANPEVVAGFFVTVVPLMAMVTYPVYRWLGISHALRPAAAVLLSLPGMFLDVLLVLFARELLPAMEPDTVVIFGAILLFGYAVVLLTGLVPAGDRSV